MEGIIKYSFDILSDFDQSGMLGMIIKDRKIKEFEVFMKYTTLDKKTCWNSIFFSPTALDYVKELLQNNKPVKLNSKIVIFDDHNHIRINCGSEFSVIIQFKRHIIEELLEKIDFLLKEDLIEKDIIDEVKEEFKTIISENYRSKFRHLL